jgi:peptidoglycan-associated lipoprotein
MNKLSKIVCFILIGSAVLMAGCPKKPKRPDPSATAAGMGPGGINPTDTQINPDAANADGLEQKPEGQDRFKEGNLIRGELPVVYFDFDRSAIKPSERTKLQEAAKKIGDLKGKQILLEGHCDWRGTAEYNMGLGDRRANAVKEYLQKLGVEAVRLEPLSKGALDAKENGTSAEMSKDRRVEIVIIKQ